jgi:hypothetical protein
LCRDGLSRTSTHWCWRNSSQHSQPQKKSAHSTKLMLHKCTSMDVSVSDVCLFISLAIASSGSLVVDTRGFLRGFPRENPVNSLRITILLQNVAQIKQLRYDNRLRLKMYRLVCRVWQVAQSAHAAGFAVRIGAGCRHSPEANSSAQNPHNRRASMNMGKVTQ